MKLEDEEIKNSSVLPMIISQNGLNEEPILEAIVCDSISGRKDYENSMPRRLSLRRKLSNGEEYTTEYVQSGCMDMINDN
jgi:hypothetical protein